ncbi:hypothetical protein [Promicromonospora sp. NPDC060271]|uniref:hypothetical protein n=1 Tax=Promicromonospora sp. NPDC060271 TaxID=3347089 RepID=UPI00365514F1
MSADRTTAWQHRLYFVLLGLTDVDLRDAGVRFDYTRGSLGDLEGAVLDRFASTGDLARPGRRDLVDGLVAYVGETLMRAAGGRWTWADDADTPLVSADPELGLAPVAPRSLLEDAVGARTGDRLVRALDRWARAVADHQARTPGWRPDKERTMADPPESREDELRDWLDLQAGSFDEWVASFGGDTTWDFTPGTLPAVQAVLRAAVSSAAGLHGPEHLRLRDGAAWYVGETFRRNLGGAWVKTGAAGTQNFPRVEGLGPHGTSRVTPVIALEGALEEDGYLSERFRKAGTSLRGRNG